MYKSVYCKNTNNLNKYTICVCVWVHVKKHKRFRNNKGDYVC